MLAIPLLSPVKSKKRKAEELTPGSVEPKKKVKKEKATESEKKPKGKKKKPRKPKETIDHESAKKLIEEEGLKFEDLLPSQSSIDLIVNKKAKVDNTPLKSEKAETAKTPKTDAKTPVKTTKEKAEDKEQTPRSSQKEVVDL